MATSKFYAGITGIIIIIILFLLLTQVAWAIDIDISGSWSPLITSKNLKAGAGSNLISTYESVSGVVLITISGTTGKNDAWRVRVRRQDSTWNANFTLFVKRIGDGTGGGGISGGQTYQAITTGNNEFFTGTGDRAGIPLQFRLEGMSLKAPPGAYSTTITYTVEDI